MPKQKQLML